MASVGDSFPKPEGVIRYYTPSMQAAILIQELLRRVTDPDKRRETAETIMAEGATDPILSFLL